MKHTKELLNRIHEDLIGTEGQETKTDFDKIIECLEEMHRTIENLENHSHTIT